MQLESFNTEQLHDYVVITEVSRDGPVLLVLTGNIGSGTVHTFPINQIFFFFVTDYQTQLMGFNVQFSAGL